MVVMKVISKYKTVKFVILKESVQIEKFALRYFQHDNRF